MLLLMINTTISRSIIWQFLAHAAPARQRVLKLKYYYPSAYSRIDYTNFSIRSTSIRDGTQTNRQKTPNLGSFFLPNYGWCSHVTTGYFCYISTKHATNH